MKTGEIVGYVEHVIFYLENHKRAAVEGLFGMCTDEYKDEWLSRDALKFWHHLDRENRNRLVELAVKHYTEG